MKSRTTGQQLPHIAQLPSKLSFAWTDKGHTIPRCKLADSFNFMMGLIEGEPYPIRSQGKEKRTDSTIIHLNRDPWPTAYCDDNYVLDESL